MIYAIGFKEWVQIRRCTEPPVAHTSQETRKNRFKIVVTYHEGGKIIGALSSYKFSRLTGMTLGYGEIREVKNTRAVLAQIKKGIV